MATPYRLRCSLLGHSMDVRAVAAAQKSQGIIVTGSRDCTTRTWLPSEGSTNYYESQCLVGPSNFVSSVCMVPPSDEHASGLIFVGSNDWSIYCYSPDSPQPLYKLLGHGGAVCALATGQFGTLLSGSWDKTVCMWFEQKRVTTLIGHRGTVWAVQTIPNKGIVLTGSADKTVRLWKLGKCVTVFNGHENCVRGLAIVSETEFLSCSNDCTVRHWTTSGDCVRVYIGHTHQIYSICVLPTSASGSEEFVTCGEDQTVRVWSCSGECTQIISMPAHSVWSVASLTNGDIIVGASDGAARVFSRHQELQAPPEEQEAFTEAVSKFAMPPSDHGGVKEVPKKEALSERDADNEPSITPVGGHFFPQTSFVRFDGANVQGMLTKMREFNSQVPPADRVDDDDLVELMGLASASGAPSDSQVATLERVLQWPEAYVFPALDLLRLAFRNPLVSSRMHRSSGAKLCDRLLGLLVPTSLNTSVNQMLVLRCLSNMFLTPSGEALVLQERRKIMSILNQRANLEGSKNTQIAMATLLLNFCVAHQNEGAQCNPNAVEQMSEILTTLVALTGVMTESEAQFRLLIAAGTLCQVPGTGTAEIRELAVALELPQIAEKWAGTDGCAIKVKLCARQFIKSLE